MTPNLSYTPSKACPRQASFSQRLQYNDMYPQISTGNEFCPRKQTEGNHKGISWCMKPALNKRASPGGSNKINMYLKIFRGMNWPPKQTLGNQNGIPWCMTPAVMHPQKPALSKRASSPGGSNIVNLYPQISMEIGLPTKASKGQAEAQGKFCQVERRGGLQPAPGM